MRKNIGGAPFGACKRNADCFKKLYCRSADIVIPMGGRVEVEKIPITGIHQVDVFQ